MGLIILYLLNIAILIFIGISYPIILKNSLDSIYYFNEEVGNLKGKITL